MTGDPEQPSTARMIDYWLGGRHHYPVDVAAAGAFEAAYGPVAQEFQALRGFLGRVTRRMREAGITDFLVVGAGIPTQGNVHEAVPDGRVLYVDLDPANVALGQQVLQDHPTAAYALGDAADLRTIEPGVLERVLPGWGSSPTGAVFLGLAAFFGDDALRAAFEGIFDAVAPGSLLAFDFDTEALTAFPEALALMGPAFRMRSPQAFAPLLGRWRLTDDGLAPVREWGSAGAVHDEGSAAFYGGLAIKE